MTRRKPELILARPLSRRKLLLGGAVAAGAAVTGGLVWRSYSGLQQVQAKSVAHAVEGFGKLLEDAKGVIDLPAGFRYTAFSRIGETMDDGLLVPGAHDGMAAFPGPNGQTILVRNHEQGVNPLGSAYGLSGELFARVDASRLYDPGIPSQRCMGGTTTVVFDTSKQVLVSHHLSLGGTVANCAGGRTPWGSWITCEEAPVRAGVGPGIAKDHGYAFEVPANAKGLVHAVPLKAMGRFNREAVAVHAASGVVYQTEDRPDGLLYRFIPDTPGELAEGGRLQALAITGRPGLITSNQGQKTVLPLVALPVEWVPLDQPDSPQEDLRMRGRAAGAAVFARGEGIVAADDEIYFVCTLGGANGKGQVWRYRPSAHEGTQKESAAPGTLELFVEPNDAALLDNGDNVTLAPFGDLVLCEDGATGNSLVGITPEGGLYPIARNPYSPSEFTGATFSPDGATLFVNIQWPGVTLAITGPWGRRIG